MKSLLVFIIGGLLLVGCVSQIGTKSPEAKVDLEEAKILEVAVKYYDAFINKKYDVIGSITQTPFVSVGNEETLTFQTKDDLIQHYRSIREPLDELNYSHSENYYRKIHFLNNSLAQVESSYGRINKKGEVFHRGKGIYYYRKANNSWYLIGRIEAAK